MLVDDRSVYHLASARALVGTLDASHNLVLDLVNEGPLGQRLRKN
jgi:hypothetical protein